LDLTGLANAASRLARCLSAVREGEVLPDEARLRHGRQHLAELVLCVITTRRVLERLNLWIGHRYEGPAALDLGIPNAVGQLRAAVRQLSEVLTPLPPTPEVQYHHLDDRDWVRPLPPESGLWVRQAVEVFEERLPQFTEAFAQRTAQAAESAGGQPAGDEPPSNPAPTPNLPATPPPTYTLGELIRDLEADERRRARELATARPPVRVVSANEYLNSLHCAAYSAGLAWRPDEVRMPGVGRIELLCDREPGEPGITAAKVRRLRARVCEIQGWRTPEPANALDLNTVADLLNGVRRVSLEELQQVARDQFHHGLAEHDRISLGCDRWVGVTGLSCKVIPGSTPTLCPNANPDLPPSLLATAEQAVRRLNHLPEGTTIHWVGHDTGLRNRCTCHPDAPYAAPFDRERWSAVAQPHAQSPLQRPQTTIRAGDARGHTSVPDTTPCSVQGDGPQGDGRWVSFNGRTVEIKGRDYQVVAYLWGRDFASFDSLKEAVNAEVADATVHTWVNRANNALAPLPLAWRLAADSTNRVVRKEPRS
jgi:hypothetical protein